jgi:hypothetical protein
MSFMWSCVNTADLTPCFGQQRDGKWTLDTAQVCVGVWGLGEVGGGRSSKMVALCTCTAQT